jgi:alcohol dehydrogenase (NADP+)
MNKTIGWAATAVSDPLSRFEFERREPRADDVVIDILFCGVCHSDIHTARSDWPWTIYPVVPGHEIVGRVAHAGANVTGFAEGDLVGVGCMVGSCGQCDECLAGLEQCCVKGCTWTYGSIETDGRMTQGGYSQSIVVPENFVLHVSETLDPAHAAPLLCAGITMYSPLRRYIRDSSTRVGIVGLGGLGLMGVKIATALDVSVTAITTSPDKAQRARELGATDVVISNNEADLERADRSLDVIISTIPRTHDVMPYLKMLRLNGTYVIVGAIEAMREPYDSDVLIGRRASITGSGIGGIQETQEFLHFCAEKNLTSDIEVICMDQINDVYDEIVLKQPATRFVIDMASVK